MGKVLPSINEETHEFIQAQHMFFVASAPLAAEGHISLSPKGLDTLRILTPTQVAYLDLTGSGVETIAHIQENERVVLMFCAFEGAPKILRLHGRGRVLWPEDEEFHSLENRFPKYPGMRAIILIEITRVSQSCGFGVPLYRYQGERTQLERWAENKGEDGLKIYQKTKNAASIDGLPGTAAKSAIAAT